MSLAEDHVELRVQEEKKMVDIVFSKVVPFGPNYRQAIFLVSEVK